jgi:hypothetical protein
MHINVLESVYLTLQLCYILPPLASSSPELDQHRKECMGYGEDREMYEKLTTQKYWHYLSKKLACNSE